jgi:enamine deaminase RidA (YjgF/YER057c/UK114 family)
MAAADDAGEDNMDADLEATVEFRSFPQRRASTRAVVERAGFSRRRGRIHCDMTDPLHVVHHDGFDPQINSLFVPAIVVDAGKLVFISGVTAAPVYHDHPHLPEVFDAMPLDAEGQARLAFEHLAQALRASGCEPRHVVMMTRYFTNIAEDQDAVNRIQGAFFGGHLPTSTTVEVKRMATDPRVRLEIQTIAVTPG